MDLSYQYLCGGGEFILKLHCFNMEAFASHTTGEIVGKRKDKNS